MREPPTSAPPRPRRGAAYVLVLSTGVLLSVIGVGVLTAARAQAKAAGQSADLDEAAALAESGAAWGVSAVAASAAWRTAHAHNVEVPTRVMGRGTVSYKLVDDADTNLSNNSSDAVRVWGIGRVGSATRAYSLKLAGAGAALDVLGNPVHAGSSLTVSSSFTLTGGALSTNGNMALNVNVTGDTQAMGYSGSGNVNPGGTRATLSAAKAMPPATAFDTYKAIGTDIPYASIPSGIVTQKLFTTTANPYGTANASGVYYVRVTAGNTLTIKYSRLIATLVVELDAGAKLIVMNAYAWDPPRVDYPSLLVKGTTNTSAVTLSGSATPLTESSVSTDFNGDGDKVDSYPAEFHGLVHVVGSAFTTTVQSNFNLKGSLLADGPVTVGASGVKLASDPALAANPPSGYSAATTMRPEPGSWRWEAAP